MRGVPPRLLMALALALLGLGRGLASEVDDWTLVALAGPDELGPGSVDGAGQDARFAFPEGLTTDGSGAAYVADRANCTIRMISARGDVSTLAGLADSPGFADGHGDAARFRFPRGVAADGLGGVFVSDTGNHVIRKISPDGNVTTVAGRAGEAGDSDGLGETARFKEPERIAVGPDGSVCVVDRGNDTIRRVTPGGRVETVAGKSGQRGCEDGVGERARFRDPTGIALDSKGTIYVADTGNHVIRKISRGGMVVTWAGAPGKPGRADGRGTKARFNQPGDLVVGKDGSVYVVGSLNGTLRRITPDGIVSTVTKPAGSSGADRFVSGGVALNRPQGIALGPGKMLWVADTANHTICRLSTNGEITVVAGSGAVAGHADGVASEARFHTPASLAVDNQGRVYVVDRGSHVLRLISPSGGVRTLAGAPGRLGKADGLGPAGRFRAPQGVCVGPDGFIYVGDTGNNAIRRVSQEGRVSTWAGWAGTRGLRDGRRAFARFNGPAGLAFSAAGDMYVADGGNQCVRRISTSGEVSTVAQLPTPMSSLFKAGAIGLPEPTDVAVNSEGTVYVADRGTHVVWRVDVGGQVTALAGEPGELGTQDGQPASARFSFPQGLGMDPSGALYVADTRNHTVRLVRQAGGVITWSGSPHEPGSSDGPLSVARFFSPSDVAVGRDGRIFVADAENHSIRTTVSECSDRPVIDQHEGPIAEKRQLSVVPQTANLFLWRMLRRPGNSTASPSDAKAASPALTPDVAGLYVLELKATTSTGKVSIHRLEFRAK
jgi:sugar lactone lactonase YvrE